MPDTDFTPALQELHEWKQAAGVEAGLRREFLARAEKAEAENARLRMAIRAAHYALTKSSLTAEERVGDATGALARTMTAQVFEQPQTSREP